MAGAPTVGWELSSSDDEAAEPAKAKSTGALDALHDVGLSPGDSSDSSACWGASVDTPPDPLPHSVPMVPMDLVGTPDDRFVAAQLPSPSDARHQDVASMTFDPATSPRPAPIAKATRAESDFADFSGEFTGSAGSGYSRLTPLRGASEDGLGGSASKKSSKSNASNAVSRLKKGWKAAKRASAKGTAQAGKALSTHLDGYLKGPPPPSRQPSAQMSADREEWLTSILPTWPKKARAARTRQLLFRGVPSSVRGAVWRAALGNPLGVSAELFDILKEKGRAGRAQYMRGRAALAGADGDVGGAGGQAEDLMEHERSAHKAILLDLPRTFPGLAFFHADGSQYETALRDMLEAFVYLRPDVGYSQGMSFLGAVLLLFMEPVDAFACFVTMLLYKSCFLQFFRIQMPDVRVYLDVHDRLLLEEMPALHAHFRAQRVEADIYMINWVMSLYCRAVPLDLVSRIWDIYVVDGDVAIFRSALGILKKLQPQLMEMGFEEIAAMLSHPLPAKDMNEDAVMQSIRSVRCVTDKNFKSIFRECERIHHEKGAEPEASASCEK